LFSFLLPGWASKGFPELAGPFSGRQVHSREEYSARRPSDESVTVLCCFWESTPGHCIFLGAVLPIFNRCFSNTAVNTSFHKRAMVPYKNICFHQFFSNQFFSKTHILLHLHYATRCPVFTGHQIKTIPTAFNYDPLKT